MKKNQLLDKQKTESHNQKTESHNQKTESHKRKGSFDSNNLIRENNRIQFRYAATAAGGTHNIKYNKINTRNVRNIIPFGKRLFTKKNRNTIRHYY